MSVWIVEYRTSNDDEWSNGGYYYELESARSKMRAMRRLGYESKVSLISNGEKTVWEV